MTETHKARPAIEPNAEEIAHWVGGKLRGADGGPRAITGFGTLDAAAESEISFVVDKKHHAAAQASAAGLIITPIGMDLPGRARIEVAEVWTAVAEVLRRLYPESIPAARVHPTAVIGDGVSIGDDVSIGPYCVIGDGVEIAKGAALGPHCSIAPQCRIGEGTRLNARVCLQSLVLIGRGVIIHAGAVLGADGFKFEFVGGRALKIPQVGRVVIEDNVEIGANTTIDRAFLYETRIGEGTKIDNLVQIGHNCLIGRSCIIAGCTGISGSVTIEDGVMLGGQVGIRDGVTIGRGSKAAAKTGISKSVPPGVIIRGMPAQPIHQYHRLLAHQRRLPKLAKRVAELEKALAARGDSEPITPED